MENISINRLSASQLEEIEGIYEVARAFMRESGNATQWGTNYPERSIILSDIEKGELYGVYGESLEGVFVFTEGGDPTYSYIEGQWLDARPYRAVHRVASAGHVRGILSIIMDYCFSRCDNIKIDTHENNIVMQKALEKYGFSRCGTIYLENGDSRIAYQKQKVSE